MSEMIGGTTGYYSTWGKCRMPIMKASLLYTSSFNNFFTNYGWVSLEGSLFRVQSWAYLSPWTDGSGNPQFEIVGPFANPSGFTTEGFEISSVNYNPTGTYNSNLLDDVEVQAYWVGRTVFIDSSSYAMTYAGLDGLAGTFQGISPSTNVVGFDL